MSELPKKLEAVFSQQSNLWVLWAVAEKRLLNQRETEESARRYNVHEDLVKWLGLTIELAEVERKYLAKYIAFDGKELLSDDGYNDLIGQANQVLALAKADKELPADNAKGIE